MSKEENKSILVKERDIVVPGQELADGMDYLPSEGAFREGDKIISSKLGLFNLCNYRTTRRNS